MEIYRKHFGKKLKEALVTAGKKQFELADKLEVNPASVSNWINGKDFPEDSRLPAICKFLNIPESYFIHDEQDTFSANQLVSLLQSHLDVIMLLPKIPKDVIKLLARQDDIYQDSLKRTLEGLEDKKIASPKKASS